MCYSYGSYSNLTDLCDDQNPLSVINAQGACFLDLQSHASEHYAHPTSLSLELNQDPLGHLYDLVDLVDFGLSLDSACGAVAFKLASSTFETFVQVTTEGQVSVDTVTLESWVGSHEVTFAAYLSDLDPDATYAKTLNSVQTIVVASPE